MKKQIELLKKLKSLAERGVAGEKTNARDMFDKLLLKYGITPEDIEAEMSKIFYFKEDGHYAAILAHIVNNVSELPLYIVGPKEAKKQGVKANYCIECTHAEFIEIEQMFDFYKKLYDREIQVFLKAFLMSNNLLAIIKTKENYIAKEVEIDEWRRARQMTSSIKGEEFRKQLHQSQHHKKKPKP